MDRAPLPPHERPWRHPSELGPTEHEPTSSGGKAIILTTATLGLLLVGVLAVSMTPDQAAAPETAASTISGLRTVSPLERPTLPLVTPVGDDGWAVTTRSALAGRTGSVRARLPSGDEVDVEIVSTDEDSGVTVVSLPGAGEDGYELAGDEPAPSDTVLVHGDPPVVVSMVELAALEVDEATPVLDEDGDLVGLCTRRHDGVALQTIASMPPTGAETTVASTTAPRPAPTTSSPTSATGPSTSRPPGSSTSSTSSTAPTSGSPGTTGPSTTERSGGQVSGASTTAPG